MMAVNRQTREEQHSGGMARQQQQHLGTSGDDMACDAYTKQAGGTSTASAQGVCSGQHRQMEQTDRQQSRSLASSVFAARHYLCAESGCAAAVLWPRDRTPPPLPPPPLPPALLPNPPAAFVPLRDRTLPLPLPPSEASGASPPPPPPVAAAVPADAAAAATSLIAPISAADLAMTVVAAPLTTLPASWLVCAESTDILASISGSYCVMYLQARAQHHDHDGGVGTTSAGTGGSSCCGDAASSSPPISSSPPPPHLWTSLSYAMVAPLRNTSHVTSSSFAS